MENIQDIWLKIKGWGEDFVHEWGLILIVFLVALGSFGLGRLSSIEEARPPVVVKEAPIQAQARSMVLGGLLVAAKTGSVYYYPWCTGVSRISAANKIWFESESAARRAGYAPAKNCKGLAPQ